jgi:chromosomal replication initiator protein
MENSELIVKMKRILRSDIDEIEKILIVRKMTYQIKRPGFLTLEEVSELVEKHTQKSKNEFCVKSRKRELVIPRQLAHCLAKRKTDETLASIGFFFGKKDHATVLYSIKTIDGFMETDKDFRNEHEEFLNQ